MWEALVRLVSWLTRELIDDLFLWPTLSNPKSKRKPSKAVKVVIKSTNGEKHGVLDDHTKR